jgi:acetyltransferase-like isoleucine patch superfamily enzyme
MVRLLIVFVAWILVVLVLLLRDTFRMVLHFSGIPWRMLKRLRDWYLVRVKWACYSIGPGFHAGRGVVLWAPAEVGIEIGSNCYIGRESQIECGAKLGNDVILANRVAFVGRYDHHFGMVGVSIRCSGSVREESYDWKGKGLKVVVGDDVWVGYGAVVLSGVTVGEGAIVGAGSVVVSDVEPYSVVAGNPARKVGERFSSVDLEEHKRRIRSGWSKEAL